MHKNAWVTIIVLNDGDISYTERLISSINRQTYEKIQVILVGKSELKNKAIVDVISDENSDKWIASAIEKAKGDFIMFCTSTTILPADYIESAITKKELEKKDSYVLTDIYIKEKDEYIKYKWNRFSLFGKIFLKRHIINVLDMYDNKISFEELSMACYSVYTDFVKNSKILYESHSKKLEKKTIRTNDHDRNKVWLIQLEDFPSDDKKGYVSLWLKNDDYSLSKENDISPLEKIQILLELFNKDKDFMYHIASTYISGLYKKFITKKDTEAYECVKYYFKKLDYSKDVVAIIVSCVGMTYHQYEYMMNYEYDDFIFINTKKFPSDYEYS